MVNSDLLLCAVVDWSIVWVIKSIIDWFVAASILPPVIDISVDEIHDLRQ